MRSLRFPADRTKPAEVTCPSWLCPAARQEWTRLARLGLLDEVSAMPFAAYCQLVARAEEIYAEVDRVGFEAAVTSGLWEAEIAAGRELLAYCDALLLTPAARAKAASEAGANA